MFLENDSQGKLLSNIAFWIMAISMVKFSNFFEEMPFSTTRIVRIVRILPKVAHGGDFIRYIWNSIGAIKLFDAALKVWWLCFGHFHSAPEALCCCGGAQRRGSREQACSSQRPEEEAGLHEEEGGEAEDDAPGWWVEHTAEDPRDEGTTLHKEEEKSCCLAIFVMRNIERICFWCLILVPRSTINNKNC